MARYTGTTGDDYIVGTDYDDTISLKGGGNDTVNAGKGNDYIDIQSYYGAPNPTNATILFNIGDGQDTIWNWWEGDDTGTIVFGDGITQDMLSFEVNDNGQVVMKVGNSGDQITFTNLLGYENYFRTLGLQFADGTTIADMTEICPFIHLGTDADDVITGTDGDDYIIGHGGNDTVYAGLGNDSIFLGEGNSTVYGGDGDKKIRANGDAIINVGDGNHEIIVLGAGEVYAGDGGGYITVDSGHIEVGDGEFQIYAGSNSSIISGNGNDYINIADNSSVASGGGDDSIYLSGYTADNVIINAGTGNDYIAVSGSYEITTETEFSSTIIGGTGDDTIDIRHVKGKDGTALNIHFNLGDGQDTILSERSTIRNNIVFGEGITSDMVEILYNYDPENDDFNVVLKVGDNGDQITLNNYLNPWGDSSDSVYSLQFADGSVIADIRDLIHMEHIGTDGDDYIIGSGVNDTVLAGAGNDYIIDWKGNNYIDAGDGDDTIESGSGTVIGGKGNDSITINNSDFGNQTFNLEYRYNLGDGQDIIYNNGYQNNSTTNIVFGEGITSDMIDISYDLSDSYGVVIKIGDGGEQITLENYLETWRNGDNDVFALHFQDGTVIENIRDLIEPIEINGTAGDDNIEGTNINDIVMAGAGDDYIFERYGTNYIDAGEGNDMIVAGNGTIIGGQGDDSISIEVDTYENPNQSLDFVVQYNLGDGQDTINYNGYKYEPSTGYNSVLEGDKIIQFGEGITSDMVTITTEGDNVVLLIGDQGDKIVLEYYLSDLEYRDPVQYRFEFADGTVWQTDGVLSQDPVIVIPPVDSLTNSAASSLADGSINNQTDNLVNALASFAPASAANSLFDDKPLDINTALLAVSA